MAKPIYLFSISSSPETININSLSVTFLQPKIDFSQYDYLIITSKQASKALEFYEKKLYIEKPALCISKQSAQSFEALGGKVLSVGGGYGDTLVEAIKHFDKKKKWLYLRAKVVASSFVSVLQKEGYSIDEAVVYESRCSQAIQNVKVPKEAVLIFTSPSSVTCYLENNQFQATHRVVVIGKTTAKALPKEVKPILSPSTTIESCIKIAKSL
jgi:uroporphyrinogen-III synthase